MQPQQGMMQPQQGMMQPQQGMMQPQQGMMQPQQPMMGMMVRCDSLRPSVLPSFRPSVLPSSLPSCPPSPLLGLLHSLRVPDGRMPLEFDTTVCCVCCVCCMCVYRACVHDPRRSHSSSSRQRKGVGR